MQAKLSNLHFDIIERIGLVEFSVLAFFKIDPLFQFRPKLRTVGCNEALPLTQGPKLREPLF